MDPSRITQTEANGYAYGCLRMTGQEDLNIYVVVVRLVEVMMPRDVVWWVW